MESQSETVQIVYALKLPMLKTGDYNLWSIRMEQYLTHTDYALWEVIVNGDAPAAIALVSGGDDATIPPKTTKQKIAKRNELKEKSTLLFGGNKESKKMQETILKQQYENFAASRSKGLDKTYDRFQKLISQLEIHDEVISQEDANLKLLRSLPPTWNTHTLIMRNTSDLDALSRDDLYNNLKVYEAEIKGQSSSNSNSQNVAFVSSNNTSSINEVVNTGHDVSAASLQGQAFASTYADDVMFSFFSNQSNSPQLDNEYLGQIDTDDPEEMDLKWQTKVECYNCHRRGHFAIECRAPRCQRNRNGDNTIRVEPVETLDNALVVTDGMSYDWSYQDEEGPIDFALMAYSSSGSSNSDTELLKLMMSKRLRKNTNYVNTANEELTAAKHKLMFSEGLDQIHDRLQKLVSQLEIHRVSLSQEDVNLNTTDSVSAAVNVFAVGAKLTASTLPRVI
nr:hypothetical protein [Tanacetum cinerariifolium]